jgi:hypothetical protein
VADRLRAVAAAFVPGARTAVQLADVVGLLLDEMTPQQVPEEVVIAVPAALVVQANDNEIASIECLQDRLASVATGDGITHWAG